MRRNIELEATIVEKYAAVEAFLDERGRRIWAATESRAIGYGGGGRVVPGDCSPEALTRSGQGDFHHRMLSTTYDGN